MGERIIERAKAFDHAISRIKHKEFKLRILKQIKKISSDPEVGKPMKGPRKGTREVYVKPFRLSYIFIKDENKIYLLDLYHKDKQ